MKSIYTLVFALFIAFANAQNFQDTQGSLEVTSGGQATYTLPIAMPPSIKNVGPMINLIYMSGQMGGIAGQGWSINTISNISRVSTKINIDGFRDGVDFDDNDKLALDGQRLILKSGKYWENESTYETEFKNNTKIQYFIDGAYSYFIVTATDGSRTWYGNLGDGSFPNAVSVNSWYIVRFEDPNENYVQYIYDRPTNDDNLYIIRIDFSGSNKKGNSLTIQNKIYFNYKLASRTENFYLKGSKFTRTRLLNNIQVTTGGQQFKKYELSYTTDTSTGYNRLTSITEKNSDDVAANPILFEYGNTPDTEIEDHKFYANSPVFSGIKLTGDFDGDGRIDFISQDNRMYNKLFEGNNGGPNFPVGIAVETSGYFADTFAITTLTNTLLNQKQSIAKVKKIDDLNTEVKIYDFNGSGFQNTITKSINLDQIVTKSNVELFQTGATYSIMCANYWQNNYGASISVKYNEGDFNGDGISEILIQVPPKEFKATIGGVYVNDYENINYNECPLNISTTDDPDFYILDLNPNQSTTLGTIGYHAVIGTDIDINAKKYIADFMEMENQIFYK